MYTFTPDQPLSLVYEDFYLAIVNTFYEFINLDELISILISAHPEMTISGWALTND
jgi:hypothetical protein